MSEITGEAVPNQYIVAFKKHIPEEVCQQHCEWAQSAHAEAAALRAESDGPALTGVGEKFSIGDFNGYVGSFDDNLKNEIEAREEVDFVEPDYIATAYPHVTQSPVPSWGLARISRKSPLPPPPAVYSYTYDSSAGAGTWGYILDTGVLITHEDFGGRAKWGTNMIPGSANTDKNGHGTHVAGTVGGTKYGVAKKCNLIAVKVLGDDGRGPISNIISGIQWAVEDARAHLRLNKSVANMSLGAPKNISLDAAANEAVRAGLAVIVAAGNDNRDANNYSPASAAFAYTVGSIDIKDVKAGTSNWGKPLDVFAPGASITSAWCVPGNTGVKTISGTSMACPHVTGLGLYLYAKDPGAYRTPFDLTKKITTLANLNSRVTPPPPPGTTRLIAYNGILG